MIGDAYQFPWLTLCVVARNILGQVFQYYFLPDSKYPMQCTIGGGGNKAPNLSEVICEKAFPAFRTRMQADIFHCSEGGIFLNNTTLPT